MSALRARAHTSPATPPPTSGALQERMPSLCLGELLKGDACVLHRVGGWMGGQGCISDALPGRLLPLHARRWPPAVEPAQHPCFCSPGCQRLCTRNSQQPPGSRKPGTHVRRLAAVGGAGAGVGRVSSRARAGGLRRVALGPKHVVDEVEVVLHVTCAHTHRCISPRNRARSIFVLTSGHCRAIRQPEPFRRQRPKRLAAAARQGACVQRAGRLAHMLPRLASFRCCPWASGSGRPAAPAPGRPPAPSSYVRCSPSAVRPPANT
jgi:hypothetical protein